MAARRYDGRLARPAALKRVARGRYKRPARGQDGAVLLVILIIIIVTTAAAAVSIENTTAEVRASGRELMTIQARYSAEAGLVTTMAWIDLIKDELPNLWVLWNADPPPDMRRNTGGHVINNDASRGNAVRISASQLAQIPMTVQPVTAADPTAPIPDPTGSFGPSQVYEAAPYEVDLTDCVMGPPTAGNTDDADTRYCVLTVRNRLVISGGAGKQITWLNVGGGPTVFQDRSGAAHDARVTVLTPAVISNSGGNE